MTSILINGGTLVDRNGERRADVRVSDGVVVEVGDSLAPAEGETVLDAAGCVVVARLRRPARPPSRAGQGGGRDDRDRAACGRTGRLHVRGGDAQHRARSGLGERGRLRPPPGRARRAVRRAPVGLDHDRPARRATVAAGRARRRRGALVHRRRERRAGPTADAACARIRARPRRGARPALRGVRD